LRATCDGLFLPRRDHGIDTHGLARGQVSGNQTDRDHYCSGNDNRKRAGDWQVGDQAGREPRPGKHRSDGRLAGEWSARTKPQLLRWDYFSVVRQNARHRRQALAWSFNFPQPDSRESAR
jgi:hypothetical protein